MSELLKEIEELEKLLVNIEIKDSDDIDIDITDIHELIMMEIDMMERRIIKIEKILGKKPIFPTTIIHKPYQKLTIKLPTPSDTTTKIPEQKPRIINLDINITSYSMNVAPIKVCTWNIMNQNSDFIYRYTHVHRDELNQISRIDSVIVKLKLWMECKTIIALQEVNMYMGGRIRKLCSNYNYSQKYSRYYNNYGIMLLWPNDTYKLHDVKSYPIKNNIPIYFGNNLNNKDYAAAITYKNELILATFSLDNKRFSVATYHMPCRYYNDNAMYIHMMTSILTILKDINAFNNRSKADYPYIFAGDFNIKPFDSTYHVMSGVKYNGNIKLITESLLQYVNIQSAHVKCHGSEPSYTISSFYNSQTTVKATVDYILYSGSISPTSCNTVEPVTTIDIPNNENPSDHIPLLATFVLD